MTASPLSLVTRRSFLRGGVGLGALMLPVAGARGADALNADVRGPNASRLARRAKSVIVLLLEGGMSHLETWDPKPDAPAEIRGSFQPIATSNPELFIGEHMPRLAREAHRYNVIRSVHSAARNHSPGLHWVLTGYDNPAASVNGQTVNTHPSSGAIVAHELGDTVPDGLPPFVSVPSRAQLGGRVRYAGASHLGTSFEAFESGVMPAKASDAYSVPAGIALAKNMRAGRLESRRHLLDALDGLRRTVDSATDGFTEYQQQAFTLLLGDRGRAAFDINEESPATRELYGDSETGQGTLLARRLVEAGVTYVLVNYSKNNSWDTHSDNFNRLKKTLLPPADQAASALLIDLDERGMLDDTLVIMMGEMGRTPIINNRGGRDHWPDVYSVMMAGGGLSRGRIVGNSTRGGEKPGDRPVHVTEVLATMYGQLGIDPELRLPDAFGRPIHILPEAYPIGELL